MPIERRTRGDLIAVLAIVLAVLVASAAVWLTSPERATTAITSDGGRTPDPAGAAAPNALSPIWQHRSGATDAPIVLTSPAGEDAAGGDAGGEDSGGEDAAEAGPPELTVVTGQDGAVTGRDPISGEQVWLYERDVPLCGVVDGWDMAVAVFRTGNGCSDVTALTASTGARGPQRSSNNDDEITLQANGTFVTAIGRTRLESWRDDLVRTLEYGRVDAPVHPDLQPRTGCEFRSAATHTARLALLERCPDESGERLTSLKPSPEDSTKPEVQGSLVLEHADSPVEDARVLATNAERTAVLIPGPAPTIMVYDALGATLSETPLEPDALTNTAILQPALGPAVAAGPALVFWTGSATIALNATTFETLWTRPGTLGAGAMMAGDLLIPVPGGISVADTWTGAQKRLIPLDRPETLGPIVTATAGAVVLEQHDGEVFAYR